MKAITDEDIDFLLEVQDRTGKSELMQLTELFQELSKFGRS
jgi:hypothetical protein